MDRFKMNFGNGNVQIFHTKAIEPSIRKLLASEKKISGRLNSPMIDRVYKARPGCSACGKKVM